MKYLIFGDIHGNLPALEKLLKKERNNYDLLICHGDVVNYGPWSNECVDLLDSIPQIITLQGNHEVNFLKGRYNGSSEVAQAFFNHTFPKFDRFDKILKYKEEHKIEDYTIRHTIENTYFYPDSPLKDLKLDQNYIIGHSHYQFDRRSGNKRLINTGSLGQNRRYINIAEYILYDQGKDEVQLKSFSHAIEDVIATMYQENYPKICLDYYQKKARK